MESMTFARLDPSEMPQNAVNKPRKWQIILAFILFTFPAHAADVRVIDGDTLKLDGETIRIENIDTPEIFSAKCEEERRLGERARGFLEGAVTFGAIEVVRMPRKDKYKRTLARIVIDGRDVGEALVAQGLARKWTGRREPWCVQ